MSRTALIFGLLALALVAGCASYDAEPLDPARAEKDFRARSLAEPGLLAFVDRLAPTATAGGAWTLEALTLAALYFHPDLDVARARVRIAEGAIVTAGQRPNPTLALSPQYVLNSEFGTVPWTVGATLDIPIEVAGKRGKRIAQAEREDEAARLALAEAAWKVRSRLRAALAEHLLARRASDLAGAEAAMRDEVEALLEARLAAGDASIVEVHQARAERATAALAARTSETRLGESRVGLADAIGVPAAALAGARFAWPDLEAPPSATALPIDRVRLAGLVNRLDVRRALAEYAAAEAALELEVAKQWPDLHVNPGYTYDQGQHLPQLGVSLDLPVLNQNEGPIAEAAARREESRALFAALEASAVGEMDRALARYSGALGELEEASRLETERAAGERAAEVAFAAGDADRVTLALARVDAAAARRARLEAVGGAEAALGALEDAVQRPLATAPEPPAPTLTSPRVEHEEGRP